MKKLLLAAIAVMGIGSLQVYGIGLGVEGTGGIGGYNAYGHGGFMVTAKFDNLPYMALGADFGLWGGSLGFTADWWLLDNKIVGPLNWYLGVGPYLGFRWYDTNWGYAYPNRPSAGFSVGVRVPIGLHVFPVKWLEIFGEFAPAAGVGFFDFDGKPVFFDWQLQAAIGVRFWF